MTKHGFELARGRRMFIERSMRDSTPSCVVLIVGAGTASFVDQELAALVSGGGCLSLDAARRAAVLAVSLDAVSLDAVSLDAARGVDPLEMDDVERARVVDATSGLQSHDVSAVTAGAMPLRRLVDGAVLEASARYWVPSGSRVWLEGRCVRVAPLHPGESNPLDALLTSLAQSWGPRSIAVLPMKPGADGERGVGALRVAGGLALPCSDEPEEAPPCSGSRLRRHAN